MRVEIDDLIDLEGIAANLGVSKQAVTNWRARDPEFVECQIEWRGTYPIFLWSKVRRWAIRTGRLETSSA